MLSVADRLFNKPLQFGVERFSIFAVAMSMRLFILGGLYTIEQLC